MTGGYCVQNTNLNDEGQKGNRHKKYCPVKVTQDVSGFLKMNGVSLQAPKISIFSSAWKT